MSRPSNSWSLKMCSLSWDSNKTGMWWFAIEEQRLFLEGTHRNWNSTWLAQTDTKSSSWTDLQNDVTSISKIREEMYGPCVLSMTGGFLQQALFYSSPFDSKWHKLHELIGFVRNSFQNSLAWSWNLSVTRFETLMIFNSDILRE